jgi:Family of unknown function (DUF5677)
MTSKVDPLFGTKPLTAHFISGLLAQCSILKGITSQNLHPRAQEIRIVLATIANNAYAVAKLGNEGLLNECTVLARAFLERVISFCYLMVCPDEEYRNYRLYTIQKGFRKLDRSATAGDTSIRLRWSGNLDTKSIPHLEEAIRQYTSGRGHEITRWTKKTITEQIELIGKETKANVGVLLMNYLSIYEDASEALHGTLYGCYFHLGAHKPGIDTINTEELEISVQKNLTLLAWTCAQMIHELIIVLGKDNQLATFVEGSKKNTENMLTVMKAVMGQNNS